MTQVELVNASDIQHGDTVICHNGQDRTVNQKDISNSFFGLQLFGERYSKGIQRVLFPRWYQGQLLGYVTQR